jgi:hypothetical protein
MAGPGDGMTAAGGRGHLRASHADREQVVEVLKAAFVQGRLAKDELDARAGQAFAVRTYGELAAVTADLPPGLIIAPQRQPARARTRPPVSKVVAGAALVIPAPAMVAAAFITGSDPLGKVAILTVLVYFMAWIAAGMQLAANWHDNRSRRGQLPPRRAQRGPALERGPDGEPGDAWFVCQARRDARARHLPGRGVIRRILWSLPGRWYPRRPAKLQVTA